MTPTDESIRVYLIDRTGPDANAFGTKLFDREGVELAGGSDNVNEALDEIDESEPDLILVGTDLGGAGCVSAVESLLAVYREAAVVVLSTSEDKALVSAAIRAGAIGSLDRGANLRDTVTALHIYQRHRSGEAVDLSLAEPGEMRALRVSGNLPVFPGAGIPPEPGIEVAALTAKEAAAEDAAAGDEPEPVARRAGDDMSPMRAELNEAPAKPKRGGFRLFGRRGAKPAKQKRWGARDGGASHGSGGDGNRQSIEASLREDAETQKAEAKEGKKSS